MAENLVPERKVYSQQTHANVARILAKENIEVRFGEFHTASFDIKNRVLNLPDWKNAPDAVYSLFIGHEVGHALYTGNIIKKSIETASDVYKNIVNIIEDVRIEKMIQKKYSGLVPAFKLGYIKLLSDNFFSEYEERIKTGSFLDRANLHFKIGATTNLKIEFSDEESVIVGRISACVTESDVIVLANELYKDYLEKKEEEKNSPSPEKTESEDKQSGTEKPESKSDSDEGEQPEESAEDPSSKESGEGQEEDSSTKEQQTEEGESQQDGRVESETGTESKPSGMSASDFESSVQQKINEKMKEFSSPDVYGELTYFQNIGKKERSAIRKAVDFYNDFVRKQITMITNLYTGDASKLSQIQKITSSMYQRFEIKKRADEYRRESVSTTGRLDMNKIHQYKYSDDLFKKKTTVKKGKNHAFLIMLDMSGSMQGNIQKTIDQLIIFSDFCRKSSIPFEVYGFTTEGSVHHYMYDSKILNETPGVYKIFSDSTPKKDYEYIRDTLLYYARPAMGSLMGNTPLCSSILYAIELHDGLKERTGAEIVNTIFLTDGDDTQFSNCFQGHRYLSVYVHSNGKKYLYDKEYLKDSGQLTDEVTAFLIGVYRDVTGSTTINFFISSLSEICHKFSEQTRDKARTELFAKKFVLADKKQEHHGYSEKFYIQEECMDFSNNLLANIKTIPQFSSGVDVLCDLMANIKTSYSSALIKKMVDLIA